MNIATRIGVALIGAAGFALAATAAQAQTVKITPLGSHDGEFCPLDRAMLIEDPDGTRILYDPGRTVAGAEDPRLGEIDVILVSHMHGDHVGDRRLPAVNAGECGAPDFSVSTLPNTNTVDIALAKDAVILTGSEMPSFFAGKLKALGGDPSKSQLVRFGASKTIGGVKITTVPAVHSNGISGHMIEGELGEMLVAAGLTVHAGPPTGYVLTFSNGLVAYLSGDTGVTAEQKAVVGEFYDAQLVVMNIGDTFTTGPTEAAYVVDELVGAASVIPSHANELATSGGEVRDGTRTRTFLDAVQAEAQVPLSGRTLEFDADGKCMMTC